MKRLLKQLRKKNKAEKTNNSKKKLRMNRRNRKRRKRHHLLPRKMARLNRSLKANLRNDPPPLI